MVLLAFSHNMLLFAAAPVKRIAWRTHAHTPFNIAPSRMDDIHIWSQVSWALEISRRFAVELGSYPINNFNNRPPGVNFDAALSARAFGLSKVWTLRRLLCIPMDPSVSSELEVLLWSRQDTWIHRVHDLRPEKKQVTMVHGDFKGANYFLKNEGLELRLNQWIGQVSPYQFWCR